MYARRVDLVLDTARLYVGTHYSWAGASEAQGFDCSGLMVELLKVGALIDRGTDYTAHQLYEKFKQYKTVDPQPGSMIFFGSETKATHVEMVISKIGTQLFTIGASGGGSHVVTEADAIKYNAFVKIRAPKRGWFVALHPFWAVDT